MLKISVIMPVYNMEKYLSQALESLINQTLEDIEIICIDDCSTDNSLKILKKYAARDKRIILLEQKENLGQGIARNRALDIAKGEYIMCLDPDDWLELDACEICYNQISKNQNDFVIFNHRSFYQKTGEYKQAEYTMEPFSDVMDCPNIELKNVKRNFIKQGGISCNKIYSRKFLNDNNIRYGTLRMGEDGVVFIKCIAYAKTISIINKVLYNRRIHDNNTIVRPDFKYGTLVAEKSMYEEIKKHNIDKNLFNFYLEKYMFKVVSSYKRYAKQKKLNIKDYYEKIREMASFLYNNENLSDLKASEYYEPFMEFVNETFSEYILKTCIRQGNCTGCSACYNICSVGAITMQENTEGFIEPAINKNKCTNCGLCTKTCPAMNPEYKNDKTPPCFGYMADDETRKQSSSGGVFLVLANQFIKEGGYVAGAVWTDDWRVKHIVSNRIEDIDKMKKSKYLQSEIGGCYKEIKKLLDNKEKVLFTGTPCQVAGLKSYLRKDYQNLYSLDILCHGVPNAKVFHKYLKENYNFNEIKDIDFRDKEKNGWGVTLKIDKGDSADYYRFEENPYTNLFLKNINLRECCGSCMFNKLPRQGDLTIADFWGIEKKYNDGFGISLVLQNNNQQGKELIKYLKKHSKLFMKRDLKKVCKRSINICGPIKPSKNREKFFETLDEISIEEANNRYVNDKCDYLIVNMWDSIYNYGACLTAWALQEIVQSFGFTTKLLDNGVRTQKDWYKNSFMENFSKKYLDTTNVRKIIEGQKTPLCSNVKGAIAGSDQVFGVKTHGNKKKFMLNFLDKNCRKIAISASFGRDKNEYLAHKNITPEYREYAQMCFNSFDYLSCREFSGREIFKDVYNLDSDVIIDPIFLLEKDKYNKLIENSSRIGENKIVIYVLDENEEYEKAYEYIKNKLNLPIEKIKRQSNDYSVEDYLRLIKECSLFITDSFHGACFAIIFHRPFFCVGNKERGFTRFETLIELFNVKNNIITSINDIYNVDLLYCPDYSVINKTIDTLRKQNLETIKRVLLENYSNNKNAQKNKELLEEFNKKLETKKQTIPKENKSVVKFKYLKYRILSNITLGEKREYYNNKRKKYKKLAKQI